MNNELIVASNPKSGVSDAIKTIRTNLQFSSVDKKVQTILVTSSIPGEGKSFISANLATAFVQSGLKVLIIDCDMRRGRQHKVFKLSNEKGLSNLLIDDVQKNYKNYIQKTEIKNLDLIPIGVIPPNPSELLASEQNRQLLNTLKEKYDIIICDGVPLSGLTDSLVMAEIVDKIVIVCAYKYTPMEYLINSKKILSNFSNKVAGIVVNKMPYKKGHYYTDYYSDKVQ